MNDNLIKNKITNYFRKMRFFDLSQIKVFVQSGVVLLVGTVLNENDKEFAEFFVKRLDGVKNVISRLELMSEAITMQLPPLQSVIHQA